MRGLGPVDHSRGMTLTSDQTRTITPPLSRAARAATAICLVAAGLTNGLAQYVGELLMPDLEDFSAQIRWGRTARRRPHGGADSAAAQHCSCCRWASWGWRR